ncbi:MAG: response regulator [Campylobacterales bacterium]|nr:response regulator [Campylobacterales bacterium]
MSKRILIVDDIGFIVEFKSKVIDALSKEIKQKILIDSANSVREALAKIAQNDYDAMVVDVNLPDGTGIDIAKVAQAKKRADTHCRPDDLSPEVRAGPYLFRRIFQKTDPADRL